MAFVHERISDEDRERNDFSVLKEPPLFAYPIPWIQNWTIDRDRDAYLLTISTGGRYGEPGSYVLVWGGEPIYMRLNDNASGSIKEGLHTSWELHNLWIPEHLQSKREEVIQLIKEALAGYGLYGRPVQSIKYDF